MSKIIRAAAMALVAAGLIGGAATVAPTQANAGVYIGVGHPHHWHHRHWRHDGWRRHHRHCRVVVRHRWHHGHRVTIRRRTCW